MKAVVVGSGSLDDLALLVERCSDAQLIIAADGGGEYLYKAGIIPAILIGDFDSISYDILDYYKSMNVEVLKFPASKDFTDMELAVETAVNRGAKEICILGAMGTRFDHMAANVFMLNSFIEKNITAYIEDSRNIIFLTDKPMEIKKRENWKVSLLSISPQVSKLTTYGLKYPLHEYTLKFGSSLGVSNEFCGDTASVSFESGLLMVILSNENN